MTEEEWDRKVRQLEHETMLLLICAVVVDVGAALFLLVAEFCL